MTKARTVKVRASLITRSASAIAISDGMGHLQFLESREMGRPGIEILAWISPEILEAAVPAPVI